MDMQYCEAALAQFNSNLGLNLANFILSLFCLALIFVEWYVSGKSGVPALKAAVLLGGIVTLFVCLPLRYALPITTAALFALLLCRGVVRYGKKAELMEKILPDEIELPPPADLGFTVSREFRQAEDCVVEGRPREAITHLNNCRGRVLAEPRYAICYADALMLLGNYKGALGKLNDLPDGRLKKKRVFKNVMVKRAACYHGLNDYVNELACYDAILARGYKPEKYFFRRGRVKVRILEVRDCVPGAAEVVDQVFGSQEAFIQSIFADFDKALGYDRDCEAAVLSYKGACHIHVQEYKTGLELLAESQKINPYFANTYIYIGLHCYHGKDFDRAIKALGKSTDYEGISDVPFYYLAKIYYEKKDYDQAIRCASQALAVFPQRWKCFRIQGDCYKNMVMYTDAIACYTKALSQTQDADCYSSRAICYYNGTPKASANAYRDICEAMKSKDCPAYRLRALIYRSEMERKKGVKKGEAELDEMLSPYKGNKQVSIELGVICAHYGAVEHAIFYYERGLEHDPTNSTLHFNLALELKKLGEFSSAAVHLQAAIANSPPNARDIKYYKELIDCYRELNDSDNEMNTLLQMEEVNHFCAEINRKNGDATYHLKKYRAAAAYYRAALRYTDSSPAVCNNLACALYYQEEYKEAVQQLNRAVRMNKNYALAYHNLGSCYLRMSTSGSERTAADKAAESYRTACALDKGLTASARMLAHMDPQDIQMMIDEG